MASPGASGDWRPAAATPAPLPPPSAPVASAIAAAHATGGIPGLELLLANNDDRVVPLVAMPGVPRIDAFHGFLRKRVMARQAFGVAAANITGVGVGQLTDMIIHAYEPAREAAMAADPALHDLLNEVSWMRKLRDAHLLRPVLNNVALATYADATAAAAAAPPPSQPAPGTAGTEAGTRPPSRPPTAAAAAATPSGAAAADAAMAPAPSPLAAAAASLGLTRELPRARYTAMPTVEEPDLPVDVVKKVGAAKTSLRAIATHYTYPHNLTQSDPRAAYGRDEQRLYRVRLSPRTGAPATHRGGRGGDESSGATWRSGSDDGATGLAADRTSRSGTSSSLQSTVRSTGPLAAMSRPASLAQLGGLAPHAFPHSTLAASMHASATIGPYRGSGVDRSGQLHTSRGARAALDGTAIAMPAETFRATATSLAAAHLHMRPLSASGGGGGGGLAPVRSAGSLFDVVASAAAAAGKSLGGARSMHRTVTMARVPTLGLAGLGGNGGAAAHGPAARRASAAAATAAIATGDTIYALQSANPYVDEDSDREEEAQAGPGRRIENRAADGPADVAVSPATTSRPSGTTPPAGAAPAAAGGGKAADAASGAEDASFVVGKGQAVYATVAFGATKGGAEYTLSGRFEDAARQVYEDPGPLVDVLESDIKSMQADFVTKLPIHTLWRAKHYAGAMEALAAEKAKAAQRDGTPSMLSRPPTQSRHGRSREVTVGHGGHSMRSLGAMSAGSDGSDDDDSTGGGEVESDAWGSPRDLGTARGDVAAGGAQRPPSRLDGAGSAGANAAGAPPTTAMVAPGVRDSLSPFAGGVLSLARATHSGPTPPTLAQMLDATSAAGMARASRSAGTSERPTTSNDAGVASGSTSGDTTQRSRGTAPPPSRGALGTAPASRGALTTAGGVSVGEVDGSSALPAIPVTDMRADDVDAGAAASDGDGIGAWPPRPTTAGAGSAPASSREEMASRASARSPSTQAASRWLLLSQASSRHGGASTSPAPGAEATSELQAPPSRGDLGYGDGIVAPLAVGAASPTPTADSARQRPASMATVRPEPDAGAVSQGEEDRTAARATTAPAGSKGTVPSKAAAAVAAAGSPPRGTRTAAPGATRRAPPSRSPSSPSPPPSRSGAPLSRGPGSRGGGGAVRSRSNSRHQAGGTRRGSRAASPSASAPPSPSDAAAAGGVAASPAEGAGLRKPRLSSLSMAATLHSRVRSRRAMRAPGSRGSGSGDEDEDGGGQFPPPGFDYNTVPTYVAPSAREEAQPAAARAAGQASTGADASRSDPASGGAADATGADIHGRAEGTRSVRRALSSGYIDDTELQGRASEAGVGLTSAAVAALRMAGPAGAGVAIHASARSSLTGGSGGAVDAGAAAVGLRREAHRTGHPPHGASPSPSHSPPPAPTRTLHPRLKPRPRRAAKDVAAARAGALMKAEIEEAQRVLLGDVVTRICVAMARLAYWHVIRQRYEQLIQLLTASPFSPRLQSSLDDLGSRTQTILRLVLGRKAQGGARNTGRRGHVFTGVAASVLQARLTPHERQRLLQGIVTDFAAIDTLLAERPRSGYTRTRPLIVLCIRTVVEGYLRTFYPFHFLLEAAVSEFLRRYIPRADLAAFVHSVGDATRARSNLTAAIAAFQASPAVVAAAQGGSEQVAAGPLGDALAADDHHLDGDALRASHSHASSPRRPASAGGRIAGDAGDSVAARIGSRGGRRGSGDAGDTSSLPRTGRSASPQRSSRRARPPSSEGQPSSSRRKRRSSMVDVRVTTNGIVAVLLTWVPSYAMLDSLVASLVDPGRFSSRVPVLESGTTAQEALRKARYALRRLALLSHLAASSSAAMLLTPPPAIPPGMLADEIEEGGAPSGGVADTRHLRRRSSDGSRQGRTYSRSRLESTDTADGRAWHSEGEDDGGEAAGVWGVGEGSGTMRPRRRMSLLWPRRMSVSALTLVPVSRPGSTFGARAGDATAMLPRSAAGGRRRSLGGGGGPALGFGMSPQAAAAAAARRRASASSLARGSAEEAAHRSRVVEALDALDATFSATRPRMVDSSIMPLSSMATGLADDGGGDDDGGDGGRGLAAALATAGMSAPAPLALPPLRLGGAVIAHPQNRGGAAGTGPQTDPTTLHRGGRAAGRPGASPLGSRSTSGTSTPLRGDLSAAVPPGTTLVVPLQPYPRAMSEVFHATSSLVHAAFGSSSVAAVRNIIGAGPTPVAAVTEAALRPVAAAGGFGLPTTLSSAQQTVKRTAASLAAAGRRTRNMSPATGTRASRGIAQSPLQSRHTDVSTSSLSSPATMMPGLRLPAMPSPIAELAAPTPRTLLMASASAPQLHAATTAPVSMQASRSSGADSGTSTPTRGGRHPMRASASRASITAATTAPRASLRSPHIDAATAAAAAAAGMSPPLEPRVAPLIDGITDADDMSGQLRLRQALVSKIRHRYEAVDRHRNNDAVKAVLTEATTLLGMSPRLNTARMPHVRSSPSLGGARSPTHRLPRHAPASSASDQPSASFRSSLSSSMGSDVGGDGGATDDALGLREGHDLTMADPSSATPRSGKPLAVQTAVGHQRQVASSSRFFEEAIATLPPYIGEILRQSVQPEQDNTLQAVRAARIATRQAETDHFLAQLHARHTLVPTLFQAPKAGAGAAPSAPRHDGDSEDEDGGGGEGDEGVAAAAASPLAISTSSHAPTSATSLLASPSASAVASPVGGRPPAHRFRRGPYTYAEEMEEAEAEAAKRAAAAAAAAGPPVYLRVPPTAAMWLQSHAPPMPSKLSGTFPPLPVSAKPPGWVKPPLVTVPAGEGPHTVAAASHHPHLHREGEGSPPRFSAAAGVVGFSPTGSGYRAGQHPAGAALTPASRPHSPDRMSIATGGFNSPPYPSGAPPRSPGSTAAGSGARAGAAGHVAGIASSYHALDREALGLPSAPGWVAALRDGSLRLGSQQLQGVLSADEDDGKLTRSAVLGSASTLMGRGMR